MPDLSSISPAPTDEEAAAIAAAVDMLWPKPIVISSVDRGHRPLAWRYSGRWWQRDGRAHADRPWR